MAKDNQRVVIDESKSNEFGVGVVVVPNGEAEPPGGGGTGNYPCAVCIGGGQTCSTACSCACQGSTTSRPVKVLRKRIV